MRARVLALVFPLLALAGSEAQAQWMFDPPEPWRNPAAKAPGQSAVTAPSLGGGAAYSYDPAIAAPQPTSEWDQSGIIGRHDRDAYWHHQERMNDGWSYLDGLRDGSRAVRPIWGPYIPTPGPLPPLLGAPGHDKAPHPKGKRP